MTTKYRFYYYRVSCLGEAARMMFALAGVPYENYDFTGDPEWYAEYQALSPTGKCPWLEIDDGTRVVKLSQSHAINQYLAIKFGLVGDTEEEAALTLMYAEAMKEAILNRMLLFYFKSKFDEATKKMLYKQFKEDTLPAYFHLLEEQLKSNQGGDGWLVGNKMTWADVYLAHWVDFLPNVLRVTPPLDECPKIKALVKKVLALPAILNYMKGRPEGVYTVLYEY